MFAHEKTYIYALLVKWSYYQESIIIGLSFKVVKYNPFDDGDFSEAEAEGYQFVSAYNTKEEAEKIGRAEAEYYRKNNGHVVLRAAHYNH